MPHLSKFTINDRSGEKSNHTLYNGAITAGSLPGFLTDFGAYRTALEAIILGNVTQEEWVGDRTQLTEAIPASNFAQRELKLLIRYVGDTSGGVHTLEIPTPDLANLTIDPSTDLVDLADGGIMAAWVTAFQTIARTPDDDTETVTVQSARVVGRNI